MIPDETVVRDFVCTGQVMSDTVSAVPQYLDPAQVGHILNTAKDMTDLSTPTWLVLAFPFILGFFLYFVLWLVDDAGFFFKKLKWKFDAWRAVKEREKACQTCTEHGIHDERGL